MTTGDNLSLLRGEQAPRRATFLELFFDLVFVVALALLSETLVSRLSWTGVAESAVLLLAIWWVWVITTLVTDLYNPESRAIKVVTVGVMFGALLMAAALPAAFGDRALMFAGAYVAIHLGRGLLFFVALHEQQARQRALRIWAWFGISAVPWLAGVVVGGTAQLVLWGIGLAIDYTVFALGYPFPGRQRVPAHQFNPTAEHLTERYYQFFIIALGDIILVAGMAFSRGAVTAGRTAGFVVAFASAAVLFRIYVHCAGAQLTNAIEAARTPGKFSRWAPFTHLLMIAGVVAIASSAKLTIDQPTGTVPAGWVVIMIGGPVVFLLGRSRFEYEVFGRIAWPLLAGVLLLLGLAALAPALSPLLLATCALLVGIAIILFDLALRGRRNPVPPAPPL
ncbi:low temperature requirement protein A [Micromonospora sp. NBC_01813]|uniref:low temperature requirement protein A n=1 Tax=Micromonospora sp. NBC_01813 TaxID=2975988 RepID=UPI002DDAB99A|nr:low temperature requirement protein A [Micromonospora sp. NBC_01813]WSA11435.1 low temperature requirement protein A [Micromonospora sp. NBC_01813]